MTDPRDLLGTAGDDVPPVDLAAVHARAGHLRRRRTAAVTVVGALVLAATAGVALGLERPPDDEQLRTPFASAPASAVPTGSPSASAAGSRAPSPGPSGGPPSAAPGTSVPRTSAPGSPTAPTRTSATSTSPTPPAGTSSGPRPTGPTLPPTPAGVPFPADDGPDTSPGTGSGLVVSSVTTAPQDGYDRTVFTFTAPAGVVPGWRVQYVDQAVQDGSGDPIALAGSSVLQVVLTGTANEASPAQGRTAPRGTLLLREVYLGGSFEGQAGAFLGLDARAPFRVFALSAPARVVVDVRTR